MESSSSNVKLETETWIAGLSARIRASAWTPLLIKVSVGVVGFFALALVGSGAAADLLPQRAGTYLGPPTNSNAAASASAPPSVSSAAASPPPVSSGQASVVPDAGAPDAEAPPMSAVTAEGQVILNLATEDDLRKLPGVGPKKAQAILALRAKLGKFKRPEDLLRVKGIGRKKLAKLRPRLLIDPPDKPEAKG